MVIISLISCFFKKKCFHIVIAFEVLTKYFREKNSWKYFFHFGLGMSPDPLSL